MQNKPQRQPQSQAQRQSQYKQERKYQQESQRQARLENHLHEVTQSLRNEFPEVDEAMRLLNGLSRLGNLLR